MWVSDSSLFCLGIAAGIASWVCLNRRAIRGDHAVAFFVSAWGTLYIMARVSMGLHEAALRATALITSTYLVSLATITVLYRLSPWHPLASYPGPFLWRISSMRLSYVTFMGRRSQTLHRFHDTYGPFVRIGPNILSVNSSSAVPIYNTMEKSESYRFPSNDGVVAMFFKQDTKDLHRERKRIWNGLFSTSGIAQLVPSLEQRTWELLQCFERRQARYGGVIDVPEALYHWSHDLTGDIVFSGCNELELMKNEDPQGIINAGKMSNVVHESLGQSPWLLEIIRRIPVGREVHSFVRLAAEMTRNRLKAKDLPAFRDLMSYLIEAGIQPRDLARDAIVAILGASDNTPVMLALACYFLAAEPHYFQLLRRELEQAFPDPLGPMPLNVLSKLPVLNGVIEEVLRLNSPYFMPRVVPRGGICIDGRYIPENTIVALAPHLQHISPDNFFPEPLNFRPERWVPQGLGPQTRTNRAVLAAFSFGPHSCIGKTLAYHEMRYVLSRVVLIYDVEFAPGFDRDAFRDGIMNIRTTYMTTPLRMRLTRRPGINLDAVCHKPS